MRVVEEMTRDRRLAWAPYLFYAAREVPFGQHTRTEIFSKNIGRGPAVNAHYCHHEPKETHGHGIECGIYRATMRFDLAAGEELILDGFYNELELSSEQMPKGDGPVDEAIRHLLLVWVQRVLEDHVKS